MKKIIVVTGGAGFVGSNLIDYFLKKTNFRILSLDNYSSGKKQNHIKKERGDVGSFLNLPYHNANQTFVWLSLTHFFCCHSFSNLQL